MDIIRFTILITTFLIPLIGPYGSFGYEQVKILFFILSISLMGFLWFLTKPKFGWTNIKIASSFFILVLLLTSVSGIDSKTSFLGTDPYFQGAIIYVYFFLFSVLVSASGIKMEKWAYILVGSATLVGLLAIKDWVLLNIFHQIIPNYAGRVVSSFGQPNFYGGFLLLTLPFFRFLLASKGPTLRGYLLMGGFLISVVAIMLSASRIAFLGAAGLILFWLVRELSFKKLVLGAVLTILLVVFLMSWVEKELTLLQATNNPDLPTIGVEKRYYFWPVLWQIFLQKPFTGYGLENIGHVFSDYFEKNKHALFEENLKVKPYLFGLKDLNLDRSHNYILDLLLFSGILGLGLWLILVVMLFKKCVQMSSDRGTNVLLISLVIYLIWIQFQNQSIVHLLYFWLLVGIINKQEQGRV